LKRVNLSSFKRDLQGKAYWVTKSQEMKLLVQPQLIKAENTLEEEIFGIETFTIKCCGEVARVLMTIKLFTTVRVETRASCFQLRMSEPKS
jgi:hypothetical protein